MPAGFGSGRSRIRRSGLPRELRALGGKADLTPAQRSLRLWVEAGQRSEVFAQLMVAGLRAEERVTALLEKSGPIGEDHGSLLRLMALSLVAGLLDEEAMAECHAVCPMQEWLDDAPRRVAWSVAVGGGKTLTAASLCRAVADLTADDPGLEGPLSRGVIYSCRTHKLIQGMLNALELMGVPRGLVGVWHTSDDAPMASIKRKEIKQFPILLTTQAQLQNASARHDSSSAANVGVGLEELLVYKQKDRLTIWDEAFQSTLAESADTESLVMAFGSLRQRVQEMGADEVWTLREVKDDAMRHPADVMRRDEGRALVSLLDGVHGPLMKAARAAGEQPRSVRLPAIDERVIARLKAVASWLRSKRSFGPADAIEAISEMASAGGLSVSMLKSSKKESQTIVQPVVVISDRLQRLVVLDAGYTTNAIAQMDRSLQLASGAAYAGRELTPKLFDRVTVHCYCGHSGRGDGLGQSGLGVAATRLKLIREQVDRIARVPLGETSLVITYGKRESDPADFRAELEACLDDRCPGWRDRVGSTQRVTVITWGEHVGANDWRHCRHIFFVGVLRRAWTGDLAGEAFAAARGDVGAYLAQSPAQIEANQAAQEIMQAIGRGHARATINGHAGGLTVHLPYKESAGRFRGMAPCEGSPLWEELSRMMPGVVLVSESRAPKASGADLVVEAAERVLAAVEGDRISTAALKDLVMQQLPQQGAGVSDRVFKYGIKLLAERNQARQEAGERCWVKPSPTARSWVRSAAA